MVLNASLLKLLKLSNISVLIGVAELSLFVSINMSLASKSKKSHDKIWEI